MTPERSNADEWHLFLREHCSALPFVAVQIAERIEAAEERGTAMRLSKVYMYSDDHGVCIGGHYHGWIVWKHPDGQFVTVRKAAIADPTQPWQKPLTPSS